MWTKLALIAIAAAMGQETFAFVAPTNLHNLVVGSRNALSASTPVNSLMLRTANVDRSRCPDLVRGPDPMASRCRAESIVMMAKAKKGKKGGKGGGGGGDAAVEEIVVKKVDTDVKGADVKTITKNVKEKMSKTIENTREAMGAIRTGRPSPNIFDKVMVEYYGAETPLPQVATVQVQSASMISIEPYEASTLKDVERAILASDLGLTPNNDGAIIRINIPALTTETRQQYVKQAKSIAEDGKVALRNIRRTGVDAVKKLEKDSVIGEDESKGTQDDIQKLTDANVKTVEELCAAKEKELNKV